MSTKVGALQAPRAGRSRRPAAFVAAVIMLTVALAAFTLSREGPRTAPLTGARTELSGGVTGTTVGGTAANTPSEIRGGSVETIAVPFDAVPHVPRRVAQEEAVGSLVPGNTPSELTGGITRYERHQLI